MAAAQAGMTAFSRFHNGVFRQAGSIFASFSKAGLAVHSTGP